MNHYLINVNQTVYHIDADSTQLAIEAGITQYIADTSEDYPGEITTQPINVIAEFVHVNETA